MSLVKRCEFCGNIVDESKDTEERVIFLNPEMEIKMGNSIKFLKISVGKNGYDDVKSLNNKYFPSGVLDVCDECMAVIGKAISSRVRFYK